MTQSNPIILSQALDLLNQLDALQLHTQGYDTEAVSDLLDQLNQDLQNR